MERFKTNIKLIRNRFRAIENHFIFSSDNISIDHLSKSNSHKALIKRPHINPKNNSKDKNKIIDKINSGNQLDQIGNDDLIFNNDKLITNIKIDNIEEFNQKGLNYINDEESKDMSLKTVRKLSPKKSNLSPTREGKNKRPQKVQSPKNRKKIANNNNNNNDALLLDCVKNQFHNTTSGKVSSTKSFINNKNLIQTSRLKNINQFINKPNETNINESSQKGLVMTPIIKKNSPSKIASHKSFNKINLKFANPNSSIIDFHNDNFNLSPVPGTGAHNSSRGKSIPSSLNNKSSIHFPNKSVMKNMDKLFKELQKIFGDKVQLNDDLYQNMSDSDKKNTINFLLDSLKEIFSINKVALSKNDGYKEIADSKEKQLKEAKNEIKELKKDNAKLNKIIKTNIQMNRKLSQSIDNLKSQLEKEKNKSKEMQTKGKSANKVLRSTNKIKYRNDSGGLSATSSKKMKGNMSKDKFRKTSDFINRKKLVDNNKSKDKKNNKKKINDNAKEKNSNNINSIIVDENKDNSNNNNNKDLLNDLIISDMNLNNDINLVENLNIDKNDIEVDNHFNDNNMDNK